MTHRLLMICAYRPKRPVFPGGGTPDTIEDGAVSPIPRSALRGDRFWCGPDPITLRSATALGLDIEVQPELAEIDFGSWRGRTPEDVAQSDPDGLRAWTAEPSATPHGGESVEALLERVGTWLAGCTTLSGRTIAVAPGSVIKACMLHALGAPADCYRRIDIEPMSSVTLVSDGRRWIVRLPTGAGM
ncbi:histidine phosphatase family protein [Ancylobacter sp. A5.8]|uniref:histidine phosphatase family protein n=1 Tax=Ancylobacter gelatini TaxID=2919920 RepID=UPI001F4F01F4|nr:histidine phosphatase family protein [Ancylobacter gelatini]MCJ8143694.1 histidine phosphatase family protein [Ancylobacter gelatini]